MKKVATFRCLAVGMEIGRAWRAVMVASLVFVAGCAHYPVNDQLAHHDPATGYRVENLPDAGEASCLGCHRDFRKSFVETFDEEP